MPTGRPCPPLPSRRRGLGAAAARLPCGQRGGVIGAMTIDGGLQLLQRGTAHQNTSHSRGLAAVGVQICRCVLEEGGKAEQCRTAELQGQCSVFGRRDGQNAPGLGGYLSTGSCWVRAVTGSCSPESQQQGGKGLKGQRGRGIEWNTCRRFPNAAGDLVQQGAALLDLVGQRSSGSPHWAMATRGDSGHLNATRGDSGHLNAIRGDSGHLNAGGSTFARSPAGSQGHGAPARYSPSSSSLLYTAAARTTSKKAAFLSRRFRYEKAVFQT